MTPHQIDYRHYQELLQEVIKLVIQNNCYKLNKLLIFLE